MMGVGSFGDQDDSGRAQERGHWPRAPLFRAVLVSWSVGDTRFPSHGTGGGTLEIGLYHDGKIPFEVPHCLACKISTALLKPS